MSIIRIKNPETGKWEVQSVGASLGLADENTYGVVKAGDGINIDDGIISVDGTPVYFGTEPPEDDSIRIWYDEDDPGVGYMENTYHPDWNSTGPDNPETILNKPELAKIATTGSFEDLIDNPLPHMQEHINTLDATIGNPEDKDFESINLIDSDNILYEKIGELEKRPAGTTYEVEGVKYIVGYKIDENGDLIQIFTEVE